MKTLSRTRPPPFSLLSASRAPRRAALHGGGLRGATHPRAQNWLVINTPPLPLRSGNSWKTSRKTRDSALRLLSHVRSLSPPLFSFSLYLYLLLLLVSNLFFLLSTRSISPPRLSVSRHIIRNRELYSAENGLRVAPPLSHVLLPRIYEEREEIRETSEISSYDRQDSLFEANAGSEFIVNRKITVRILA